MASPEQSPPSDGPPRGVLIAAVAVAALAVVGVLVVAALQPGEPDRPVAIVSVPAPQADSEPCRALLGVLPDRLDDYERAPVADPAPPGAAAWQRRSIDELADTVILRCGLERPPDFVAGTPVQMVDDVAWFRVADEGRSTWITVDRPAFVALTLRDGSGSGPIQLVSAAVAKTMPAVPIEPGPAR